MKQKTWLLAWLTLVTLSARAQDGSGCRLAETLDQCRERIVAAHASAADAEPIVEAAEEKNRADLAVSTPGESPMVPDAATTANDFISRLRISADSGGLNGGESEESILVELNELLGVHADGLKFTARLAQAELFQPLVEAIPEDGRADAVSSLEEGLDDFDDVTLALTYSPFNERRGRRWDLHDGIWSELFSAARERIQAETDEFNAANDECTAGFDRLLNERLTDEQASRLGYADCASLGSKEGSSCVLDAAAFEITFGDLKKLYPDETEFIASLQEVCGVAETARMERLSELASTLESSAFYRFGDLINNQPQVYFSAEAVLRDDLVGPDELKARFTFEKGWVNVNSFKAFQKGCAEDTLTCLDQYLNPRTKKLLAGNRVAVSIEYADIDDYSLMLADPAIMLDLEGSRRLEAQLVYGRYLAVNEDGQAQSRVDIGYTYQDVEDDPMRQDRGMGTLTYTQRVSSTLAFSASLVYASDPEFRGHVDKDISARVGLNYRLLHKEDF